MKNINKILETLTLSASDTREDTLKSILVSTLMACDKPITHEDFFHKVESEFGLQLYEIEFKSGISQLVDNSNIVIKEEKYSLSEEHRALLRGQEYKLKSDDTVRYNSFKTFLETKYSVLTNEEIKGIWQLFREYIYECFYYYGVKANQMINPKYLIDIENVFTNSDILFSLYEKLNNTEHREILKYAVDNFASYATKEDIDFLDELGQKTLAFTSLGLDPELAKDSFDYKLVDWILFLDTNFLFSILDLHNNVEDDACKELVKLIQQNPDYIKIEFKYTELTIKELRKKKEDFTMLDKNLSKNSVNALLKSDELDEFSRKFYTKLYNNPEETLHPSEVIDLANITLPQFKIDIYRTKPMVESLGEALLNVRVQEYQRYINQQNELREEYHKKNGGRPLKELYRSDLQLEHDITLREVILFRRSSIKKKQFKTMNDTKYFAATLDELLLRYDNYELRKSSTNEYPVFFKPSYLLNKLIKVLPVKTQDYKKAFIKAVSARGFNKDIKKSRDIIRIVSYLKNQGIDNEEVILNLITEQVFLERFREESSKDTFDIEVFIESELNRLFDRKSKELEKATNELASLNDQKEISQSVNIKLSKKVETLSEQVNLYQNEFNKIHSRIKKLEKKENQEKRNLINQGFLEFENAKDATIKDLENKVNDLEQERNKILETTLQQERQIFYLKKKRQWRFFGWLQVSLMILITLGLFFWLLYNSGYSFSKAMNTYKSEPLWSTLLTIITLIGNLIVIRQIYDKYYNHSNIKAFEERLKTKLPEKLK